MIEPRAQAALKVGLADAGASLLLLIDIQPRLIRVMPPEAGARAIRQSALLARAAELLNVPVVATRQYPSGLGPLADELLAALPTQATVVDKSCFSCFAATDVAQRILESGRRQIVLAGVEAHVCVLQTAYDLLVHDLDVHVAADAVCSRAPDHAQNALSRLRSVGVTISNAESIVFEWLRDAAHPQFRQISALLR